VLILYIVNNEVKVGEDLGKTKYSLWVHAEKFEELAKHTSLPKSIVQAKTSLYKGVLCSYLLIPFNGYLRKLNVVFYNGRIYSWGDVPLTFIKTIMEYCVSNKFNNINAILDAIISYTAEELYKAIENVSVEIDRFEEIITQKPELKRLHRILSRARRIRKAIFQLNSFTSRTVLSVKVSDQIVDDVRRLLDHADRLLERITLLTQFHYMVLSDKVNSVVQKLTIISAIFLPLTLIASIYGMNFKYMPELNHPLAYPVVLAVMLIIAIGQLAYFRKKKWI